jgi:tellurite resistance protein
MTGLEFEIDEDGLISNYDEVMTKLYEKLNNAITSANADGNADEDEQEKIDKIQE